MIARLRSLGIRMVADAFGIAPCDPSGTEWRCSVCGAERRGRHDRRGPVGTTRDGQAWRCHRCGAGGDAASFAAALVLGTTRPDGQGWKTVRERCRERGLLEESVSVPTSRVIATPQQPRRVLAAELDALWKSCRGVTEDEAVCSWLADRRSLDPWHLELLGTGRALPVAGSLPTWARFGRRSWPEAGYRLVLPLFGATGKMESLRARLVLDDPELPKEVSPQGDRAAGVRYEVSGLLFAEPLARLMLGGKCMGDGRSADDAVREFGVVITEGSPDFLTAAQLWCPDAREDAPAVLGVFSGSWTDEIACRIPDGAPVRVVQHPDAAGAKYGEQIRSSLASRCPVVVAPFSTRGTR